MMKRNMAVLFVVTLFLIAGILFEKKDDAGKEKIQMIPETDVEFSAASGFYKEAFRLTLKSARGYDIYYTLDGSEPNKESLLYQEPVLIENPDQNPNIYAGRTDTSTGFLKDDIERYSVNLPAPNYEIPSFRVEKCMVIRAVSFDEQDTATEIVNRVYFVEDKEEKSYQNIGVISIVTDPVNLFDYDSGIYVTGAVYEEYADSDRDYWADGYWCHWPSNYTQRGKEWERTVWVDYFDADGKHILGQNAGIRIHGGGSRGFAEKSLNLYSRKEYSGKRNFNGKVFDSGYQAHKLMLFSGGDDVGSKLKDYLVHTLSKELDVATMDFIPCALFLDGEYWGVYYLTEAYDADYIKFHYNVGKATIIKNGLLEEGYKTGFEKYQDMMDFLQQNDMSNGENYEKACSLIDMESYIDYYASLIYVARTGDWPGSNVALWRSDTASEREYEDGRWRFMVFDVNSSGSIGSALRADDTLRRTIEVDKGFRALLMNPEFKKKFCVRLMDMGNVVYREEKVKEFIDEYTALMEIPMTENNRRFYGEENAGEKFLIAVNDIQTFFVGRQETVLHHMNQNFGFEDIVSGLQISINDEKAGKVQANSLEVEFKDRKWDGMYITEYPVKLQAEAEDGYQFLGWRLSNGEVLTETGIEVNLKEDAEKIEVLFQEIK